VLLEDRTAGRPGESKSELVGEMVNMVPEKFFVRIGVRGRSRTLDRQTEPEGAVRIASPKSSGGGLVITVL